VSQSVPHFHVHVVPRRKGDGLKGFFWPRRAYKDAQEIAATLRALHAAIAELQDE
jgi:histidine triad (HIT) family protein